MIKKLVFLLFSLTFSIESSALTVNSVEVNDRGHSIIIQGTGFGSQPKVAVHDSFDPPAKSSSNTRSSRKAKPLAGLPIDKRAAESGSWTFGHYTVRYDNDSYSGSYSALLYRGNHGMRQVKSQFKPSQEVFISYWVKLSGGNTFPGDYVNGPKQFSSDSSWKFAWLIDKDYKGNSSDVSLPTHVGNGGFYLGGNDFNIVDNLGNDWWSWDEWIRLSFWLKADDLDPTSPGTIQFATRSKDRGYKLRTYNRPVFDDDGPSKKAYRQINFPGWIRSLKDDDTNVVYDDIYVAYGSGAVARVEVADKDNYGDAQKIYILPQEEWSKNEIKVKTPGFLTGKTSGMYLYITDAEGNVNQKGVPIGAPAPAPITDLELN